MQRLALWGPSSAFTEQDATRLLAERGVLRRQGSGRSYASIVRANVLTVFNVILAGFGVLTLIFGDWQAVQRPFRAHLLGDPDRRVGDDHAEKQRSMRR
ncbi:MAG TPA: hypothetical protein VNC12_10460 [Solirubrobacteraceae bacterium]|nr:hypothetical protein [Solirubrobacteraceae bacterium]